MSAPAESPDRASCRLFFAICPPAATRRQIADFLHANPAPAKAVPPQNWHVTVLFVGEVDPGVCCQLKQLVLPDLPPAFMLRLVAATAGWLAGSVPATRAVDATACHYPKSRSGAWSGPGETPLPASSDGVEKAGSTLALCPTAMHQMAGQRIASVAFIPVAG
jgi:hypothetical protein